MCPDLGSSRHRDLYHASTNTQSPIVTASLSQKNEFQNGRADDLSTSSSNSLFRADSLASSAGYSVVRILFVPLRGNPSSSKEPAAPQPPGSSYARVFVGTHTSSEVPRSRARSSSDHIVGTGISRGRNFRYSVHGVGTRSLGLEVSRLERTKCAKRYIIISARVDFDEEQSAVVSARSETRANAVLENRCLLV